MSIRPVVSKDNLYAPPPSPVDLEELSADLPPNRFECEHVLVMSKLFTIGSRSAKMDPLHYAMALVNGHPLESGDLELGDAEDEMPNFSHLFQLGTHITTDLDQSVPKLDRDQKVQQFEVDSPRQLLLYNLALSRLLEEIIFDEIQKNPDYAPFREKVLPEDFRDIEGISNKKIVEALQHCGVINNDGYLVPGALLDKGTETALAKAIPSEATREQVLDILYCVEFRSQPEMIRMRLTRSTFLDPRLLSKMSRGKITPEDAHLLLSCVGLQTKADPKMICDLRTSEVSNEIPTTLRKKHPPSILFVSPKEVEGRANLISKIDENTGQIELRYISEGTKYLAKQIFEMLGREDPQHWEMLKQEYPKAASDHTYLRQLFSPQEGALSAHLDKLDQFVAKLPNQSDVMEECLTQEARNRLKRSTESEEVLAKKFNEVKHILRHFLLFSTHQFELPQPHEFELKWKMAGIEVLEKVTLEKSCSVMRRLQFPIDKTQRTDLTYEQILIKWKEISEKHHLSDSALADLFLTLYRESHLDAHDEVKQFFVPLVILLMGKEPALDRASLIANFIFMFSVKLGIYSFSDALQAMPVIPQGGVSAKQYLLHTTEQPIDALSGVQYKNKAKHLPRSHFLPTVSSFVGRADDWIEKYDYVAETAVKCCQRLFIGPLDETDPDFITFKKNLEDHAEGRELDIRELPFAIDCQWIKNRITAIENICHQFMRESLGQRPAVRYCQSLLLSLNIDENVQQNLITPLQNYLGTKYPPRELAQFLDLDFAERLIEYKKHLANQFLITKGQHDDLETAIERCLAYFTRGIDPKDPDIQTLKALLEKIYRHPLPFHQLVSDIEYEGSNDDDDEIGKWAIDYISKQHPLQAHD